MKTSFSLLFYLKKPKNYVEGPVPIYIRITINGQRAETTVSRECEPNAWHAAAGRMKGTKESVRSLNAYLENLRSKINDAHAQLTRNDAVVTAEILKNKFLGKEDRPKMILEVFAEHNQRFGMLVGKEVAKGTLDRYEASYRHTERYIRSKYRTTDLDIRKIDHEFIMGYDFWLRTERNCNNNSTVKYIKNFKKIILLCLDNGWIDRNPFIKYKGKVKVVDRQCLQADEIERIHLKEFAAARLNTIKDIFLFSCYTGLAYVDIRNLSRADLVDRFDGETWININRQKTDIPTRVPLLPQALDILGKYKDHPVCCNTGKAFPVPSNQKMNSYLKEIADICGINIPLTFHIARHTFATTVTLANGVPIESVSVMLGHTNIKTTQQYAKILNIKLSMDMQLLKNKLSNGQKQLSADQ